MGLVNPDLVPAWTSLQELAWADGTRFEDDLGGKLRRVPGAKDIDSYCLRDQFDPVILLLVRQLPGIEYW